MNSMRTVLLVDDNENDVFLMHRAFKKAEFQFPIQEVRDGEEAISYLKGEGVYGDRNEYPVPAMILLDLNMPKKNGFDVLTWIQTQPDLQRLTVVVTTASTRPEDVTKAYELGATCFLVKPSALAELEGMVRTLRDFVSIDHFPPRNGMVSR
jgi:CheY-like chemotaxis protein